MDLIRKTKLAEFQAALVDTPAAQGTRKLETEQGSSRKKKEALVDTPAEEVTRKLKTEQGSRSEERRVGKECRL